MVIFLWEIQQAGVSSFTFLICKRRCTSKSIFVLKLSLRPKIIELYRLKLEQSSFPTPLCLTAVKLSPLRQIMELEISSWYE